MRKLLAGVLCAAMALSFTACGQTDSQSSSADTSSASTAASETEAVIGADSIEIEDADGNNTELSSQDVTVTIGDKSVSLSGVYVVDGIDATIKGGTYESTGSDENVFLVINGGSLKLSNAKITKSGDASASDSQRTQDVSDDYNFYGLNSVILTVGEGSTAEISDCTIESDCDGANAIFSTDGAEVTVNNVEINTTGNSARGVYATYEGSITAENLTITTEGAHCAPIATDRGGGDVDVSYSKLNSSGDGSPSIYSTGDITVDHVEGVSTGAQAAVIEGKNSITITDSTFDVSGDGTDGIMIYQSMSGDAADSDATADESTLNMSGTTISVSNGGPLFYITNTTCEINLNGGNTYDVSSGEFLSAAADRWGNSGSNGGTATLNITDDEVTDSVSADDISSVTINGSFSGTTEGNVTTED